MPVGAKERTKSMLCGVIFSRVHRFISVVSRGYLLKVNDKRGKSAA